MADCSQTAYYQAEDSPNLLMARVAQIQFVNNGDEAATFSPQVDGVTLVGQDDARLEYTLAAHDTKMISYRMNPTKYGNSEGACYALNVGVAQ